MTLEHVIMLTMAAIIIVQRIYIKMLEKNQFDDSKMIKKTKFLEDICLMPKDVFNAFVDDMISLRKQAQTKCE